jgi:hypothetical protein
LNRKWDLQEEKSSTAVIGCSSYFSEQKIVILVGIGIFVFLTQRKFVAPWGTWNTCVRQKGCGGMADAGPLIDTSVSQNFEAFQILSMA